MLLASCSPRIYSFIHSSSFYKRTICFELRSFCEQNCAISLTLNQNGWIVLHFFIDRLAFLLYVRVGFNEIYVLEDSVIRRKQPTIGMPIIKMWTFKREKISRLINNVNRWTFSLVFNPISCDGLTLLYPSNRRLLVL